MKSILKTSSQGFSRNDLLVCLAVLALLGALSIPLLKRLQTQMRQNACMANLKQIGAAAAVYRDRNQQKLPYAYLMYDNRKQSTWDSLLAADLGGKPGNLIVCPDDPLVPATWAAKYNLKRRSYSVTKHDMREENWPPTATNRTGIGVWWTFGPSGAKPPSKSVYNFDQPNQQAAVTRNMIQDPAKTILITEQISSNNIAQNASGAFVSRSIEQLDVSTVRPDRFHKGKFNYLMVDGHVETMYPEQTVGVQGQAGKYVSKHLGMWTITPED